MADNKINLIVKSTAGTFTDKFNVNHKAQKVFDQALEYFRLAQGAGASYILVHEADRRDLALGEKIEDLGLSEGDVLLLNASQAQDG